MADYLVKYRNNQDQEVERELEEMDFFQVMSMIIRAGFVVMTVTRLRDAKDLSVWFSNKDWA